MPVAAHPSTSHTPPNRSKTSDQPLPTSTRTHNQHVAPNNSSSHPTSSPNTRGVAVSSPSSDQAQPAPALHVNGKPAPAHETATTTTGKPEDGWGSNFWVTLVDPQTGVSFFACPASGEVSWDPPVGNFLLPPSPEGEWWEMTDESTGLPYYYQTKTGETVWERPNAFVIPLGILQNTALARRLSLRNSQLPSASSKENSSLSPSSGTGSPSIQSTPTKPGYRRSRYDSAANPSAATTTTTSASATATPNTTTTPLQNRRSQSSTRSSPGGRPHYSNSNNNTPSPSPASKKQPQLKKSTSTERYSHSSQGPLAYQKGHPLAPIPGSPYATDSSPPPSPSKRGRAESGESGKSGKSLKSGGSGGSGASGGCEKGTSGQTNGSPSVDPNGASALSSVGGLPLARSRSSRSARSTKSLRSATTTAPVTSTPPTQTMGSSGLSVTTSFAYRAPAPQSLAAALEQIALSSTPTTSPNSSDKARDPGTKGDTARRRSPMSSPSQPSSPASPSAPFRPSRDGRAGSDAGSVGSMGSSGDGSGNSHSPTTPTAGMFKLPLVPLASSTPKVQSGKVAGSAGAGRSPGTKLAPGKPVGQPEPVVIVRGKEISAPTLNAELTQHLSPIKSRALGKPILVEPPTHPSHTPSRQRQGQPLQGQDGGRPQLQHQGQGMPADIYGEGGVQHRRVSLNTGIHPILPDDLASDILQFSESRFAMQYFSTHRTGFIFKRKVPVSQMMSWQKTPLNAPLLQLTNKHLFKEASKVFRSIQRIMGDRSGTPNTLTNPNHAIHSTVPHALQPHNGSTTSLHSGISSSLLEEERWLLSQGLTHGELRDEIYCQVMKQLTGNPSTESVFKGWQLLCVLLVTFPPSKNFQSSLHLYVQQATSQHEGRVDVMAKYCLRRLDNISRKGPRGKPPTLAEIEVASDAAFHPSIFGETLDVIFRLQERNYPHQRVPIILPFLADGILALGGTKSEGIFRVPGDGDSVSELKLRIDKGYYTLDGFDDPTILASCLKLWLRELSDPLVPEELYNDCITHANDPEACVQIVQRLPTIHRRVVLFVVSFLQLFLEEKVMAVTKMTSANLALVMAPNLLRCNSDSIAVVFTNAQYEQTFVHNLLLHLQCSEVDPDYAPTHGRGAVPPDHAQLRKSKSRRRAPH